MMFNELNNRKRNYKLEARIESRLEDVTEELYGHVYDLIECKTLEDINTLKPKIDCTFSRIVQLKKLQIKQGN